MAEPNFFDQFDGTRQPTLKERGVSAGIDSSQAGTRSSTISAAKGEAELPYVAPKGSIDVRRGELGIKNDRYTAIDKLRDQYEGNKDYQRYAASIPALASALGTASDPEGDIALTYYAAKLFDPDSAVREGEQATLSKAGSMLDRAQARIRKEFGLDEGGTYTEENRAKLRRELIRRGVSLDNAYNRVYSQYRKLAQRREYDPFEVVGDHLGTPHMDALKAYDERMRGDKNPREAPPAIPAGTETADLLAGPMEGHFVGPENIKSYRLSPGDEKAILAYVNGPDFTPEGYAAKITDMARKAGVAVNEGFTQDALTRGAGMAEEKAKGAKFGAVDYSEADKVRTENANLMDLGGNALKNLPESAYNAVTGAFAPGVDLLKSIGAGEREGIYKTFPDIAKGLLGKMGVADLDESTADAAGAMLKDRYGSIGGFKRAVATDPIGVMGDLSLVLTGGGSAAARLPGAAGDVGRAVAAAGRVVDPLSLTVAGITEGPGLVGRALPDVVKDAAAAAPAGLTGLPSGLGGNAVREAFGAGRSKGRAGADTPQSQAFTQAMRDPNAHMDDVVEAAQGAVQELRDRASTQYQAAMAQFGRNPVPLDLAQVQQEIDRIRPRNYEAMLGNRTRPAKHLAWEQMRDTVQHYRDEASADPSLAEPLRVDQFKQDLYDIGSRIGGVYDRDAARMAGTAYNAVKNLLTAHDPIYARTMADYERAARQVQQMEGTFSIAAARNKQPNVDTAMRKLQSIFRNNAYSNYGQRLALGEEMGALDPTGTLMPGLAGQTASSFRPRSLLGGVGGTLGAGSVLTGGVSPAAALAAPLFSPRAVGESAYGLGRATGAVERVAGPTATRGQSLLDNLYTRYQNNPASALAASQVNNASDDLERQRQEDLLRRYNMTLPGVDPGFARGGRVSLDALAKRYGC